MRALLCTSWFATCLLLTATAPMVMAQETAVKPLAKELALPGKKGVCFTLRDPNGPRGGTWKQNLPKVKALKPYWNYSWGPALIEQQPPSVEFVPMIWGGGNPDRLQKNLQQKVLPLVEEKKIKRLLGFNEPDKKDQANMKVEQAIKLWPQLEALGIPLCSPACANTEGINDPSAQGVPGTWMRDFMKEVEKRNYRVDYVGVHWYGGTHVKGFQDKLKRIYDKYGRRPLLITEFAPADWKAKTVKENRHSQKRVLAFMKEILPWLEEQEWIAGYAWFSFNQEAPQGTSSALFDKDGNLTACGRFYASVTNENPQGDQTIKIK